MRPLAVATRLGVLLTITVAAAGSVFAANEPAISTPPAAATASLSADEISRLLVDTDRIRRGDPPRFREQLARLDLAQAAMTPAQREHYDYLRGYDRAFAADVDRAIPILSALRDEGKDPVLRFRAGATLANALYSARRYREAFERLNSALDQLPQITDPEARAQVLSVAAQLYSMAGQAELALEYTDRIFREPGADWAQCFAARIRYDSIERGSLAAEPDPALDLWIRRCAEQGEEVLGNIMRISRARMLLRRNEYRAVIDDLDSAYARVRQLDFGLLTGLFEATYAEARRGLGDDARARKHALAAIAAMPTAPGNEPMVHGLRTLYLLAKSAGDVDEALKWYEQYTAADQAFSDDRSQRVLAYQMASHESRARALEIERLASENRVLQLQQELGGAAARAQQLAITLLLAVLASIAFWTWRLRQSRERFRTQVEHDALTGIAARQHFMAEATAALAECRRRGQPAALVLIDLDHFKQINDVYGHVAGDDVLRQAVAACRPRLGQRSVFGRLGGEEFGVLLPNTGQAEAHAVADACRAAVAAVDRLEDDRPITVSASFGIAIAGAGQDLRQLLIAADAALYEAKRQGRNRVVDWEAGLAKPRPVPATLATASRQA
jgi:diguanylate cyclase (GGDEF)-like protein